MNLSDKVALVTGAAGGIGVEITRELLKNGIKAVSLLDINETAGTDILAKLSKEFSTSQVTFIKTDVTDMNALEDAFKKTIDSFGGLDIVVNNAGVADDREYELEINVNFAGVLRGTLLGLKYMGKDQQGKGGIILNTASVAAFEVQQIFPVYAGTKAGIVNMSRGFGHPSYYRRTGVKVIALCPGKTLTELLTNVEFMFENMKESKEVIEKIPSQTAAAVGRAAVHAIKHGESSSIWAIDESKLYQVNIPPWKTHAQHVITFNIPV
ncbi:Photoreceptor dehydrogenase [Carabus blaptoides fortunei]